MIQIHSFFKQLICLYYYFICWLLVFLSLFRIIRIDYMKLWELSKNNQYHLRILVSLLAALLAFVESKSSRYFWSLIWDNLDCFWLSTAFWRLNLLLSRQFDWDSLSSHTNFSSSYLSLCLDERRLSESLFDILYVLSIPSMALVVLLMDFLDYRSPCA